MMLKAISNQRHINLKPKGCLVVFDLIPKQMKNLPDFFLVQPHSDAPDKMTEDKTLSSVAVQHFIVKVNLSSKLNL